MPIDPVPERDSVVGGPDSQLTRTWAKWFRQLREQLNAVTAGWVPASRRINTSSPITGGGDLTNDLTVGVKVATSTAVGVVKPDGITTTVSGDGTITATSGTGIVRTINTQAPLVSSGTVNVSLDANYHGPHPDASQSVQLSDGTGNPGNMAVFGPSGELTDGGPAPTQTEIQVNGVDTTTQSPVNFIDGTHTTVTNPTAGEVKVEVPLGSTSVFGVFKVDGTTVTETGGVLSASGTASVVRAITAVAFDSTAISTGVIGTAIQVPFSGTIIGWSIELDTADTVQIAVSKHANSAPPSAPVVPSTTTDKISASAPIATSSAQTASSGASGVSTWTTSVSQWDTFLFNIISAGGTAKRATATLLIQS